MPSSCTASGISARMCRANAAWKTPPAAQSWVLRLTGAIPCRTTSTATSRDRMSRSSRRTRTSSNRSNRTKFYLIPPVTDFIRKNLPEHCELVAPLAIGTHRDHVLTRTRRRTDWACRSGIMPIIHTWSMASIALADWLPAGPGDLLAGDLPGRAEGLAGWLCLPALADPPAVCGRRGYARLDRKILRSGFESSLWQFEPALIPPIASAIPPLPMASSRRSDQCQRCCPAEQCRSYYPQERSPGNSPAPAGQRDRRINPLAGHPNIQGEKRRDCQPPAPKSFAGTEVDPAHPRPGSARLPP